MWVVFRDLLLLEYNCQPVRVRVKRVKVWEYVGVGNDDIQGDEDILRYVQRRKF